MIVRLSKSRISGSVVIPSSKSEMHRALICAALSDSAKTITGDLSGDDVLVTKRCLEALGSTITVDGNTILVTPINKNVKEATMFAESSGSTLRFMLCICAMLGITVHMDGSARLRERPLDDLIETLTKNGITFSSTKLPFTMSGKVTSDNVEVSAKVSSQYATGLMLGAGALKQTTKITITGNIASKDYIKLTGKVMKESGVRIESKGQTWIIFPDRNRVSTIEVNGDWSSAAFFAVLGALNGKVSILGVEKTSTQGDKQIINVIRSAGGNIEYSKGVYTLSESKLHGITFDAKNYPDLVPIISILLANAEGDSTITNVDRLKVKESDRLSETIKLLSQFGINSETDGSTLTIHGGKMVGGKEIVLPDDHRMAMSAAIAAVCLDESTTLVNAECVSKSYPRFFEDLKSVGGNVDVLSV